MVALVWALLLFIAFNPGLMSSDSLSMLTEGLRGEYSDWHSPFVAFLLGKSYWLVGSTWPVLCVQVLGLTLGCAALLRDASGRRGLVALVLLVVFLGLPTTWALGVTLWKDVLAAVVLLWGVLLRTRGRAGWALVCLAAAALTRHNAVIASAVLVPWVVAGFPAVRARTSRWVGACVGALLLLAALPGLVERAASVRRTSISSALFVFDAVGVYVRAPEAMEGSPLFSLGWNWDRTTPARLHDPYSVEPILWGDPAKGAITTALMRDAKEPLAREWSRLVRTYPRAYLSHRLAAFAATLGVGGSLHLYHRSIDANDYGLQVRSHTAVHRGLAAMRDAWPESFFRGWMWMVAALVLSVVGFFRRRRDGGRMFWVAASGLLYGLSYLLLTVSSEFRFFFWTVVSVFAASALWLVPSESRPTSTPGAGV
ncbi:hypothetical protein LZ198_08195 [Myxococcus sp. K15C18031901]|uniref:hypothetical protein n=1 Tax=Myxococcus dinghuensis TaxID=2906761 RepID=UPI0020A7DBC1|nr:hypothetical protein [Myxococcus dinghuensis]MCP3098853.1 hypothetical protein [Myxococcus dinghuensis]